MTIRKYIGLIALFVLALSIVNATAQAQTTNHQIPYRGYLELNGASQSGQFDFIFELYDDATAGNLMWSEGFTGVTVAKGRFSVVFGTDTTNNPLSDSIWQEEAIYLAIQVKASGDPTFVQLSGRQRILPVPYAARAETAKNYRVTGQLDVDGNISTGTLAVSSNASVNGNLTVSGRIIGPELVSGSSVSPSLVTTVDCPSGKVVVWAMGWTNDLNHGCEQKNRDRRCSNTVFLMGCVGQSSCTYEGDDGGTLPCTTAGPACLYVLCE